MLLFAPRACASLILGSGVLLSGCLPTPVPPGSSTVTLAPVVAGLAAPVALVAPDDGSGRLFVADQVGLIYVVDGDGTALQTPLLDISDQLVPLNATYDERGLLGLALHPEFASNERIFVFYVAPTEEPTRFDSDLVISEFTIDVDDENLADPDSERVILRFGTPQSNHNGGQLAFGPDGYLYVGVGDGGNANDVGNGHNVLIGNGQDLTTLHGKILRIDVDGDEPYEIPPSNPFVDTLGARDEIYALGLRNPWRFSFDVAPGGTTRLFVGDVGQQLYEEVSLVERGGNYGWRVREGNHCFDPDRPANPPDVCLDTGPNGDPLLAPIIEYAHTDDAGQPFGQSVIGGFVYRGALASTLRGQYLFGDWSAGLLPSGRLFAAAQGSGGTWSFEELRVAGSLDGRIGRYVRAFGQDAAGELYILASQSAGPSGTSGEVYKIIATAP